MPRKATTPRQAALAEAEASQAAELEAARQVALDTPSPVGKAGIASVPPKLENSDKKRIACRCGWTGSESDLIVDNLMKTPLYCPRCKQSKSWVRQ